MLPDKTKLIVQNFFLQVAFYLYEMIANRQYKNEYLHPAITYITQRGTFELQCVICAEVFSKESFEHNKLKRHLETKHCGSVNKE